MNREIPFDFIFDYLLPIGTITKPFFGMFAVRHGQRLLLLLRQRDNEPEMNGIWIATTPDGLDSLQKEFPALICKFSPKQGVRRKDGASWLLIPPDAADFERTAISICELIVRRDPRIGRIPKPRAPRAPRSRKTLGLILFLLFSCLLHQLKAQPKSEAKSKPKSQPAYAERYRPQFHFSPAANWMNDPNGMVYDKGIYHLFFQYYPDSTVWGPMHWGHAVSKDLIHWRQQPIALYPDSLGYIFSGSAVVDKTNTSGFGKPGRPPLVAIFTQHDPEGEKRHTHNFQNQSIAYSLDNGRTWIKYAHNPVLRNPGNPDFRDPKVSWYPPGKKWIMTLAVRDRVIFYSSPDLIHWNPESQFGQGLGAHGGVWECPDLFLLTDHGLQTWVLIVNINPGGPNGGSATQYFLGSFDGRKFTASTAGTRWLDNGPDEYAGITWSNSGERKIFLGWMSNWSYAQVVPTSPWRSANTLPRQLGLQQVNDSLFLTARPVKELAALVVKTDTLTRFKAVDFHYPASLPGLFKIDLRTTDSSSFALVFSNDNGENAVIGYDQGTRQYYIDRRRSGNTGFSKDFAGKYTAPRISGSGSIPLTIYADASSFELFADGGLTTMTALTFPSTPYTRLEIQSPEGIVLKSFSLSRLKSIWR